MTPIAAIADVGERERGAMHDIFARWGASAEGAGVLKRVVEFLAPMRDVEAAERWVGRRLLMNAQLSVDTRHPDRLRLTLDPFAGQSFQEVRRERLVEVLRAVACEPLLERGLRLFQLGYASPQSFWLGLAPTAAGCVVKAYVASPEPILRGWLPHLARDAGWLPATVHPTFTAVYDRLSPALAALEGIGISFSGERCLGTTFYLRAMLPWSACASAALAEFLGLSPAQSLERLPDLFPTAPAAVGWSLECDPEGVLVDVKLEAAPTGRYVRAAGATYARQFGLDTLPIERLADDINDAGLSGDDGPSPAVMSLRFVGGALHSLVAYFPLAAMA